MKTQDTQFSPQSILSGVSHSRYRVMATLISGHFNRTTLRQTIKRHAICKFTINSRILASEEAVELWKDLNEPGEHSKYHAELSKI